MTFSRKCVPFTPFERELAKSNIAIVTAAGVHLREQEPFNISDELGDLTFRIIPPDAEAWGLPILSSVDDALGWGADVLYMLRLQKERMTGARIPSVAEYASFYSVSRRHLPSGVLVMHPGPVNRGVEISGDVVLDASSLIPDQVAAGVCVRSAVLALATGAVQKAAA